jgi:hypothetical protein
MKKLLSIEYSNKEFEIVSNYMSQMSDNKSIQNINQMIQQMTKNESFDMDAIDNALEIVKQSVIYNSGDSSRITERLYILEKSFYTDLFENLIITGTHSILVDHLTDKQREATISQLGHIFVTDNKYRLLACIDEKTIPYPNQGTFDIYHICLENEHDQGNYGIYANGLLVESCCKRHIN